MGVIRDAPLLVEGGLRNVTFPAMHRIRRRFPGDPVPDVEAAAYRELSESEVKERFRGGMRVAVGVGSRGVANVAALARAAVRFLRDRGAEPFIIPAMGSHGGATAEGQIEILRGFGVTEAAVGAPVRATMDVVEVARSAAGHPVYLDRHAADADGVLLINRVKPHTDFRGELESGLMKMAAIGLGKHKGPAAIHQRAVALGLGPSILDVARAIVPAAPVLAGLAVVENGHEQTHRVAAIPGPEIEAREKELLRLAKEMMPSLPADEIDVLIVEEMGKEISGCGMDPNILGRLKLWGQPEFERPRVRKVVVLGLTEATHGNAVGIGLADITTRRLLDQLDPVPTFSNAITSTFLERGQIPIWGEDDCEAIALALKTCGAASGEEARVVRIRNTLHLGEVWVSSALLPEVRCLPGVTVLDERGAPLEFRDGRLMREEGGH